MELQVTNSPFNQEQAELLNRLLPTLTETQRIWLSGYLDCPSGGGIGGASAGCFTANGCGSECSCYLQGSNRALRITDRQFSHGLAKKLSKKLEEQGFQVTALLDEQTSNRTALKKVQNLLILVSTHGEGDPPDNAIPFYEFLHSKRAPQLEDLRYSVLALGDTSYEFFCQTGKDFDKRLEELGGKRLTPRVDCDVDYDEPAAEWMNRVIGSLSDASAAPCSASCEQWQRPLRAGRNRNIQERIRFKPRYLRI